MLKIPIIEQDGQVELIEHWLPLGTANAYFSTLSQELSWEQESLRIYGHWRLSPRLTAWYGDDQLAYTYSGKLHIAKPWHSLLFEIKQLLEMTCATRFNSVLCNYYRDNHDSMGWHADNEAVLGVEPVIASVSLGAARELQFKHRRLALKHAFQLTSGSLLIMSGQTQRHWLHAVPKRARPIEGRINLTYRYIQ